MGVLEAICVSRSKGERKTPVHSAVFEAGLGICGDAHAGRWHRQVSILAAEDIAAVREAGLPDLKPGDFAENVILRGVDLSSLGFGSRIRLGRHIVLSITQIGKVCHTPCRIYYLTGDCIMPRLGLFAKVETGGQAQTGDPVEVLSIVPRGAQVAGHV
jgi:MOSC domain-containing protein YiiM